MLVDTHAHLDLEEFDDDRDEVIGRAIAAGVMAIMNPGIDLATSERALALADRYGIVFAALGIHPNRTAAAGPGDVNIIARLAEHPRVVAIGEIGLDFYRDRSPRDTQARIFRDQLDLARDLDLPVIIHFREVGVEGIDMVGREAFDGIRGVFHCFGGSAAFAREVVDMGFHIGFDGPLTYPKSDRPEVAREVPLERCLVETDAPFLAPQSHRGRRNEPAYAAEVARALAGAKELTVDEVIACTGENARRLFGLGTDIV